jgi:hypothetical protein
MTRATRQARPARVDASGRRVGVEGALVLACWLTRGNIQQLSVLCLDRCRLAGRDGGTGAREEDAQVSWNRPRWCFK